MDYFTFPLENDVQGLEKINYILIIYFRFKFTIHRIIKTNILNYFLIKLMKL